MLDVCLQRYAAITLNLPCMHFAQLTHTHPWVYVQTSLLIPTDNALLEVKGCIIPFLTINPKRFWLQHLCLVLHQSFAASGLLGQINLACTRWDAQQAELKVTHCFCC